MRRKKLLSVVAIGGSSAAALADLSSAFSGFQTVNEVGVTGLTSSYHTDVVNNLSVTGPTTSTSLPNFGPDRVLYANSGAVPSPGGDEGKFFDEGMLGWRVDGVNLVVQLASGLNPLTGHYSAHYDHTYGQGDMFVSVEDSAGVRQFALLSAWAQQDEGPVDLGSGYAAASAFHTGGGIDGGTREGNLIHLLANNHVQRATGTGAYNQGNAPDGLDIRIFAKNGTDLGDTNMTQSSTTDFGQEWYLTTWTVPMNLLSSDADFDVAFHASPSCANDQIGGGGNVPEPASLSLLALGSLALIRRR